MNRYKKLILKNSLLICLIFSVLFLLGFYIERYSFSKKSYEQQARNSLREISRMIDASFTKLQDYSILFNQNTTYFKEYVESPSPTPTLRKDLSKYLTSEISAMPSNTAKIFITQPNDKYIVSSGSVMSPTFFTQQYGLNYESLIDLITNENPPALQTPYVYITESQGKTYFATAIRNDKNFTGSYTIILLYEMDSFLVNLPEYTSLLISQGGFPLYCNGDFSYEQLTKIAEGRPVSKYTTVASYSSMTTVLGHLSYTLILPTSLYSQQMNRHLVLSILSAIVLFLLSLVLSRRLSAKAYSPIDRLVAQINEIGAEPSENEIEAISSFISVLNNKNKELSTVVSKSEKTLREKFLSDFLHGRLSAETAMQEMHRHIPDIDNLPPFFVVVLGAEIEHDNTFGNTENLHSFYGVLRAMLENEFCDSPLVFVASITPSVYGFVLSYNDAITLTEKLKNLLIGMEIDLGTSIHSTISEKVMTWKKLPHILLTTYYRHTTSKLSVATKTVSSTEEHSLTVLYSPEIENEIYTSCIRQNKEKLFSALDFLLNENFNQSLSFEESRSQLSILFYALCTRIFAFSGIEAKAVFGEDYNIYHKMKHCESFFDFSDTVRYIFITLSDAIKSIQTTDEHNYGEDMIEFIHQNYQRDVSLHDLATHMNMSQAYISRLFKKLTNYNFKDYLSKVRIEKATQLLSENSFISIQDVAAKVGYSNPKPFTALFIKTMGVSPSEYRKMNKKN